MNMSKRTPTHEEQPNKLADATSSFSYRKREALIHKIQAIDGSSRREAEMQIDALAAEFRKLSEPRHIYRASIGPGRLRGDGDFNAD